MKTTNNQISAVCLLAAVISSLGNHGFAQESDKTKAPQTKTKVVLASEVEWEQLNPKRGDQSPQAATLWGDRNGTEATGFLAKFVIGFSSPPHIHNVSYRAVVIAGGIHNDDPDAKPMWMPAGSFWTQPAGEVHITASRGVGIALVEIDKGPYLVQPPELASDNGERPVNIDPSNIVWLDASNTSWISPPKQKAAKMPMIAFLWGEPSEGQMNGTFIKLPAGFSGEIRSQGVSLQAVVIEGQPTLKLPDGGESKVLTPGSYVTSQGSVAHEISCTAKSGCLVYVRSKGKYEVASE